MKKKRITGFHIRAARTGLGFSLTESVKKLGIRLDKLKRYEKLGVMDIIPFTEEEFKSFMDFYETICGLEFKYIDVSDSSSEKDFSDLSVSLYRNPFISSHYPDMGLGIDRVAVFNLRSASAGLNLNIKDISKETQVPEFVLKKINLNKDPFFPVELKDIYEKSLLKFFTQKNIIFNSESLKENHQKLTTTCMIFY
jgi:hypothetical protein